MKSLVFLIKENFLYDLEHVLENIGIKEVNGKSVAIKLHMGEYRNLNYIRPPIIGKVVEIVKKFGGKPFLFETPTAYESTRDTPKKYLDTARRNGFTEETIGCPIIITNEGIDTKTDGKIGRIEVGKQLYQADFLIVVSHAKGHSMAGFGGALKNLGIGCLTTKSKDAVHSEMHPILDEELCKGSADCKKKCKWGAITIENNKAKINYSKCTGCGDCVKVCSSKALKSKNNNFQEFIAEGSSSIIKKFRNNQIYINVLFDIAAECDCEDTLSEKEFPFCRNIGFLVSKDPVSIDHASIDLINETAGKNIFFETHKIEPKEIIDFAVNFSLGNKEYDLQVFNTKGKND